MKNKFFMMMGVVFAMFTAQSCSTEVSGDEEDYTVTEKAVGTLDATAEIYHGLGKSFTVPEGLKMEDKLISGFEFLPDGSCVVTYADVKKGVKAFAPDMDGVEIPIGLFPYTYDKETQTYSIPMLGIVVDLNGLKAAVDGVEVAVEEMHSVADDATTDRLCHMWKVEKGLVKFYKDGKLVGPYTITGKDLAKYGIEKVAFTRTGKIVHYHSDKNSNLGIWRWKNASEQVLSYDIPGVMRGDANIYFENNDIYVEQPIDMDFDTTSIEIDGKTLADIGLEGMTATVIYKGTLSTGK